jgi:hypothetical protein
MGHYTVLGDSAEEALRLALEIKSKLATAAQANQMQSA